MPSVYDTENFAGRVNHAAAVIARRGRRTRHFDTCFEMWDGVEVAVAVYRRSLKNPKLAANIWTYLGKDVVMSDVEALKDVPTRELPARAAGSRVQAKAAFEQTLEERRRQRATP